MEYTQIPQNTFRPIKEGYDKLQSLSVQRRINITSPIPDSPLSPRPSKYSRSFILGCETTGSRQSSRADSIVQSCSRPNSSNLYFKSNNSSNSDISVAKNFQDLSVSNRRAAFKTQKWSHSLDQACLNSSPSGAKRRQASLQQKSLDLDSGYLGSPSSGLLSAQSQPWIDLPSTNHCPEPGKDSVLEIDKARKELAKLINFQETESMNRSLSLPSFTQSFHNRSLHEHIQEYCNQNPIPEPSPSHDELDALDEEIKRIVGDLQSPESYIFSSSTLNHDLNKECVKPTPIRSSTRTFSPSVTKESEEFLYVKAKDTVYSPLCNSEEKNEYNTKKDKPLKQNLGIDNVEDCPVMLAVVRTVSQKYDVPREDYSKGINSQLFSSNSYSYPGSNQPSKSQINLESLLDEEGQGCFLFTSTPVIQTVKKELSQPKETNCDIFQPQRFFDKNGDANLHTQGVKHVQYNDIQSLLSNNIQDPYENNVGETEKTNSVEDNSVCESRRPDELNHFIFKKTSQFSVVADVSDADQADSQSDTSSTADMGSIKESGDPNLVNPQRGQGYGIDFNQQQWKTTAIPPRMPLSTTPKPSFAQESARAMLEFGIIVGVAFMVGGMFMAMVGLEILFDKVADKYREVFKKPKILPDVERLHPAELVGTFSRYK